MTHVYESDAFAERVNFAANYISAGRSTTRTFDTCFEMHDGNCVAVALLRRAEARPNGNLAKNLFKYISEDLTRENAKELANVPTKKLGIEAAKVRAKAGAEFDASMAERETS